MRNLNKKIIKELKGNSRQTNIQLAKKLKVSEGTIRQRIQKIIKKGIIKKFTIELSTLSGFSAFVLVKSNPQVQTKKIIKKIQKIEDVKNIYETTGEYDIILQIITTSANQFNNIIEKIRTVEGIKETKSLTLLDIV